MADMTPTFLLEEDQEPMATEPIYPSSDEIEYSTPNTTPDHQHENIYIDSINQLIASQLKQRSNMSSEIVFYPPTPNTFKISDDDEQLNLTPIVVHPEQCTSQIAQRYNHPIQLCQHVQPIQKRPNHHPWKIKSRATFSTPMISPTHRHQHHTITPSISRQLQMDCKV